MKVTFIGLGKMGMSMAANLVKGEGIELTVVNRSQGKVREMVERGAIAGTTPAAASAEADVVCLCLSGEDTVEEVLTAPGGVLSTAREGIVVVDNSTVHPEFAKQMGEACKARGVHYLDAPVSGTGKVAWDGRLTIMAGGDPEAFERVQPVLNPMAAATYLVGPVGSGNITKLINNMLGDINQIAVMEGFVLGAKLGLDVSVLFEVLRSASASSRQLERVGPKILNRDFQPTSSLKGHVANQQHTRWLCEQAGVDLLLRNVAEAFWKRGLDAGLGAGDPTYAITLPERDAGIEVRGS